MGESVNHAITLHNLFGTRFCNWRFIAKWEVVFIRQESSPEISEMSLAMSLGRKEAKYPLIRGWLFSIQENDPKDLTLNASVRAQIGHYLRHLFDEIPSPLPEPFQLALLRLEDKLRSEGTKK